MGRIKENIVSCAREIAIHGLLEVGMVTNIILWIIFAVLVTISVQLSNVTKLLRSIDAKNVESRPD